MHSAIVIAALVASAACVPFGPPGFGPHGPPHTSIDDCTIKHTTATEFADSSSTTISSESLPTTTGPVESSMTASSESAPVTTGPSEGKPHHHHHHRQHHNPHKHHTTSISTIPDTVATSGTSTNSDAHPSSPTTAVSDAQPTSPSDSTGSGALPTSTSTWSKTPVTTAEPTITSKADTSPPSGAGTSFPYPSGSTYVDGWTWSYSAPTQMTWTAPDGAFQTGEHVTSYVLTATDAASATHVTTTTTTEAACTPAAADYTQTALSMHNDYRANHTANPVVWDDSLACIAQRQANTCIWEHLTYIDGGGYGQNLAGGDGVTVGPSIDMWYGEAPNFSPYYGEANPGGDFGSYGHFTQLVWAYTTSVGCATVDCGSGNGGPSPATGELTVCNYYAFGNMADFYGVYVLPPTS